MLSFDEKTILYVDDEEINLSLFKMNFSRSFNILTCNTPIKALEILKERKIKLLISDFKMPDMNGMELIKNVKKNNPEIICIILSGYLESDVSTDKKLLYRYIMKP